MIDLKGNPFYLSDEDIRWVEDTFESMTLKEKLGQLFVPMVVTKDEKELQELVKEKKIGGMLYREGAGEEILNAHRVLQENSRIPLLTASNLECGGVGSALEGTYFGREMLAGATGDPETGYRLGKVSCAEGKAVGANWAFAPVVDVDVNFRNPITNVRTFGRDTDMVIAYAKGYLKAAREEGVATAVKHFPGDGIDERDQHLLTSVNTLSCEEWDEMYGRIYKAMIEEGTLSVMSGHIALPAYEAYFGNEEQGIIPATLSKNLLIGLLRGKLGFNGVIVSDATPMVGFCSAMDRERAVPLSIESGCDMFLFNKNMEEDYSYMERGYEGGILSEERLSEAVKRILAMKAALKLHVHQRRGSLTGDREGLSLLNCSLFHEWAKDCADRGVTLVKDRGGFLPLSFTRYPRILLEILGDFPSNDRVLASFRDKLEQEGFQVTVYEKEGPEVMNDRVESFKKRYDLVLYIANIETASNKTVSRIQWHTMFGLGNNIPWFAGEIPCVFVSVGNPYHLLDVPMIRTYVNGYCNSEYVIEAVVKKLTGRSKFRGISPVDPFCQRGDTRY